MAWLHGFETGASGLQPEGQVCIVSLVLQEQKARSLCLLERVIEQTQAAQDKSGLDKPLTALLERTSQRGTETSVLRHYSVSTGNSYLTEQPVLLSC